MDQDLYVISLRPRDRTEMPRIDLGVRIASLARAQEPVVKIHSEEGNSRQFIAISPDEAARVDRTHCGVDHSRTPIHARKACPQGHSLGHRRSRQELSKPIRSRRGARKVKMVWTSPQVSATAQFSPAIQIGKRWRVSVPRLERYLHGVDQSS